ncbi:Sphingosine-1-phosphate lyase [Durusdinium trenchii]|uniref:Sphingosine-1-phosphate lyase n=1 Tax=Durusdinium trenchii TaxID=1381693 RepID=A0ABP0J6Q1_9DINO
MLVARMAQTQLEEAHVATLEDILSSWSRDFPGMSSFVSSAVWPDHIKCTNSKAPACLGLPATSLNAFDTWHFVDLDYNPDRVSIDDAQHPYQNPSAVWALRQAMSTFSSSQSTFAVNFMLRMAIHILADLHQPLHAAQGVFNDTRFGDVLGDRGGNLIRIQSPWKELRSLHLFWDAAGGLFLDEWPLVPEAALKETAVKR